MISTLANPRFLWHIGHYRLIGSVCARTQQITLHRCNSHKSIPSRTARTARKDVQTRRRGAHHRRPPASGSSARSAPGFAIACWPPLERRASRLMRTLTRPQPARLCPSPSAARTACSRPRAPGAPARSRASLAPSRLVARVPAAHVPLARAHSAQPHFALPPVRPAAPAAVLPRRGGPLSPARPRRRAVPVRRESPAVSVRAHQCARALARSHSSAPPHRAGSSLPRSTQLVGSRGMPSSLIRGPARSNPMCGRAPKGGAAT